MEKIKLYLIGQDEIAEGHIPLGLAYIAGYIRARFQNVKVKILDQMPRQKIIRIIKKEKPEFMGFSALSADYYRIKKLADILKRVSPKSYTIIGGSHITVSPKSFEKSNFDIGVIGEGELSMEEIINTYLKDKDSFYSNLKKVKGLLLKGNPVTFTGRRELIPDLSILPIPARDLTNMKFYSLPRVSRGFRREADVITSRGCPFNCSYCCSPKIWQRKVRFFPIEIVVEDVENLYRKYKTDYIYIEDDIFAVNKDRIRKMIELLKKKRLLGKITFACNARANVFDEETAILFKELNVDCVRFGFETGSPKMLKLMKRETVSIEDGVRAIKFCRKHGLSIYGYFMIGTPHESEEDMMMTYNFIKNNGINGGIFRTLPLPGTEIWEYALKNKLIDENYYEDGRTIRFDERSAKRGLSKEISEKRFEEVLKILRSLGKIQKDKITFARVPQVLSAFLNPYFYYIKFINLKTKIKYYTSPLAVK